MSEYKKCQFDGKKSIFNQKFSRNVHTSTIFQHPSTPNEHPSTIF